MKGNGELPLNWAVTKLGILFELEYGKGLTKKDRVESGTYPVYGSNGIVGYHDKYLVEGPVLIVGRKGAAGAVSYSSGSCWPIDTTYFVRESECIDIKFSYYLLKSLNLAKHEKSTAIPGLNRNDAYDETVFLPPLNEQKRIVAKIEALFAELDAGVASLKRAQAQLKTYRQALLKHAFTGKLTEQWRAENADQLEDGSTLLQRIRAERQARHEAALAAWSANGRQGQKPRLPKDLPPLTPAELEELPQLPAGWAWVRIGELSDLASGVAFKKDEYSKKGVRLFQIANVTFGAITWEKTAFLPEHYWIEYPELRLFAGDLVMALNRPLLGDELKIGILSHKDAPAILYQRVGKFIPYMDGLTHLIFWYLRSPMFISTLKNELRGVNIPFINQSRMLEYPIPICSMLELNQISQQLEVSFSIIDQLEQTITTTLQQAEALRQSILKKAFSGQLVPQDPADEPAAVLLARIRAAKP